MMSTHRIRVVTTGGHSSHINVGEQAGSYYIDGAPEKNFFGQHISTIF